MLLILFIALSLSADSFSVSVALGLNYKKNLLATALKTGLFFGLFQGLMPVVGWLVGYELKQFIINVDHWIAFSILCLIGFKMMFAKDQVYEGKKLGTTKIIFLSLATSIDALIIGLSLSFLQLPIFLSCLVIGVTTFVVSVIGFYFGEKIRCRINKLKIFAGLILIFIGLKILIGHVF